MGQLLYERASRASLPRPTALAMNTLRFAVSSLLPCFFVACAGVQSGATQDTDPVAGPVVDSAPLPWKERLQNPVGQPTIFEAPTIQGEVRPIFIHQKHPDRILGLPVGGDFQLYALQFRVPLTDELAFIATKDGFIDFTPDSTLSEDTGFANLAAGLKYAAYQDDNVIITPGATLEIPTGTQGVFQGEGDGILRTFVSAGYEPTEKLNVIGSFGASFPFSDQQTESLDYHLHLGYEVTENFMPLFEIHGITYTSDADTARPGQFQLPFVEGGDLLNLGSVDVEGNDVITGDAGARFKISDNVNFGAAYGFPLGDPQDLLDYRLTFDLTITF